MSEPLKGGHLSGDLSASPGGLRVGDEGRCSQGTAEVGSGTESGAEPGDRDQGPGGGPHRPRGGVRVSFAGNWGVPS